MPRCYMLESLVFVKKKNIAVLKSPVHSVRDPGTAGGHKGISVPGVFHIGRRVVGWNYHSWIEV